MCRAQEYYIMYYFAIVVIGYSYALLYFTYLFIVDYLLWSLQTHNFYKYIRYVVITYRCFKHIWVRSNDITEKFICAILDCAGSSSRVE